MHDVFISYRWVDPDQTWVREQLAPALRNSALAVLLDVDDFVPGRDLILEMTRAGRESRHVLWVLSPDYFDGNRMVAFESLMARRLDPSGDEPGLIPLMLRSCKLPEWLRGLIPIDWTNSSYHAREWRKLLKALGAPSEGPAPGPAESGVIVPDMYPPSASKYYVYISDSKVNMLYPQVRTGTSARQDSIGKLETVVADLVRGGRVGTIDEPKEYFAGAMPMRWGPCLFMDVFDKLVSGLVYFGGLARPRL
jgi:TIR domain